MPCSIDHSTIKAGGFCTSCGVRIEYIEPPVQPVQQSAPSVNYCPNGHAVASNKKFCETCGTPMTGSGSAPASAGYASPSVAAPYIPPQTSSGAGFAAQPHPSDFAANQYPSAPPKKNNTGLFVGLGAAASIILILIIASVTSGSGGGGGVFAPQTTTVSVTMSIKGQYCSNLSWGYSDIPSGSVILSVDGVAEGFASYSAYGTDTSTSCDFDAYFYDIPTDGAVYSIRMASGLRGTIENYQYELESNGWQFNLSLG